MRPKQPRGTNDPGYAQRRAAEIRSELANPYRSLRAGLQEVLTLLTVPNPVARRLVKGGR